MKQFLKYDTPFHLNALFLRQDFMNIVWDMYIPLEAKGLTCGIFYPSEKNLSNFLYLLSYKSMKYFRRYEKIYENAVKMTRAYVIHN